MADQQQTVTMLAPNGQSGDIPADQVAAAQAKGFRRAVSMTAPNGTTGYIPEDKQQDALKAGYKSIAETGQEQPGMIQRLQSSFDKETAPAEGDNLTQTLLKHAVHGAGAMFVHPLDTAAAAVKTAGDIADPRRIGPPQMVKDAYRSVVDSPDKLKAITALAGEVVGGLGAGEATSPAIAGTLKVAAPVVGRAAGRLVLLGKTPEGAYESALKPSTTLSPAERAAAIKTGLQNEIPISKAGLDKLNDQIETLNQAIKDEIAKDPTRPIDPNKVATRADAAKARFATQVNKAKDLQAIEDSRNEFLDQQGRRPGQPAIPPRPTGVLDANGNPVMTSGTPAQAPTPAQPINASDAQAMKQGTYRVLKGKFGEQGSASVEAQKALARGLKEEIATQFPEISKLNAEESRILELKPLLERAVNRISNHQAIGIGTPAAGVAAEAMGAGGAGSAAMMVMKAVLDNPSIKSRLAIAVSKGAKIPFAKALARVSAYSESLGAMHLSPQESNSDDTPIQPTTSQP